MGSRERGTNGRSAVDVAVEPGQQVAPGQVLVRLAP